MNQAPLFEIPLSCRFCGKRCSIQIKRVFKGRKTVRCPGCGEILTELEDSLFSGKGVPGAAREPSRSLSRKASENAPDDDARVQARYLGRNTKVECPNCKVTLTADQLEGDVCSICGSPLTEAMRAQALEGMRYEYLSQNYSLPSMLSLKDVFKSDGARYAAFLAIVFFAAAPIAYLSLGLHMAAPSFLFYSVYFSLFWGVALFLFMGARNLQLGLAVKIALFCLFPAIPATVLLERPFADFINASDIVIRLFGNIAFVGYVEEFAKSFFVVMLIRVGTIKNPREACLYGIVSGLTFAAAEGFLYSYGYERMVVREETGVQGYLSLQILRFISLPLFHAALTAIVCMIFSFSTCVGGKRIRFFLTGLSTAAFMHGVYNAFSADLIGLAAFILIIALFTSYYFKSQDITASLDSLEI